jgi:8-oxo-dGTP diphosphatase
VWHREVTDPRHVAGYDGVIHDFFLVPGPVFAPRGQLSDEELAAENITAMRWWSVDEIAGYTGPEVFAPRDLAARLDELIKQGVPPVPTVVGL